MLPVRCAGKKVTERGVYVGNTACEAVCAVGGVGGGKFDSVTVGVKDALKTLEVSKKVLETAVVTSPGK